MLGARPDGAGTATAFLVCDHFEAKTDPSEPSHCPRHNRCVNCERQRRSRS
jgi:hypothetical protein